MLNASGAGGAVVDCIAAILGESRSPMVSVTSVMQGGGRVVGLVMWKSAAGV